MIKLYKNPWLVLLVSLFVTVVGLKQFIDLPIALYPNTTKAVVNVRLPHPMMHPEDLKAQYGKQIESVLMGIEGAQLVTGDYTLSQSFWTVEFDWGVDEKKSTLDVQSALSTIEATFPDGWDKFRVHLSGGSSSQLNLSMYSDQYSQEELHKLLKDNVLHQLERIEGIEDPGIFIPLDTYIRIELKPSILESYGLSPSIIKDALLKKKYDKKLGTLQTGKKGYDLLVPLKDKSLDDIKQTIIFSKKDHVFRVDDVAEVSIATKRWSRLMKGNGRESVFAYAGVKSSGNIAFVCQTFIKTIQDRLQEIDPEIKVQVLTNPSQFIEEAITNVIQAILMGVLIATFVIFLFLNSFSNTFVIALSIPLSLIGGFILMSLMNIELNLISLGAMALAVGMVVDGAIVVLENVARHLDLNRPKTYKERVQTVIEGVKEVKGAVIASLLTTIIVFTPLAFTAPLANAILGDLAKVIVCVLVISILVTLYLVPPLLILLRGEKSGQRQRGLYLLSDQFSKIMDWLQKSYVHLLAALIQNKLKQLIFFTSILMALCVSIFLLTTHVKREIIAQPDSDKVFLFMNWKDGGETIADSNQLTKEVEDILETEFKDDISHYFTNVWKKRSYILCTLKSKHLLTAFKERLEARFKNSPKAHYWVNPWNPTSLKIPHAALLEINVSGKDDDAKRHTLDALSEIVQQIDHIGRSDIVPDIKKTPYIALNLDHDKIQRIHEQDPQFLTTITSFIEASLGDVYIKEAQIGDQAYQVSMTLAQDQIKGPEDLKNLIFKIGPHYYPLRQFAYPVIQNKWNSYYSENSHDIYRIKIFPKQSFKGDLNSLKKDVMTQIKESPDIDLSHLQFLDTDREINESLSSLVYALFLALTLILMVLSYQFGNIRQTLIIMLSIPLGLIGVSLSLYLFSSTLSVNSLLGMILLSGTAVNNSIIFVDFFWF